ncbi:MAG: DegT/DnrJ/EryC1/StrS family aminotransferase [bacterium]
MENIKLSKSIVGEEEKRALAEVIDESYLGMGQFTKKFEDKLARYLGVKEVICVNSGTSALHLSLMSILKPGDEVLVQSLTFVACYQAISACFAIPISCEIDPKTCLIDLNDAKERITNKTKAIMPVHYAGRVGDLDKIYDFAREHKLRVIEDASHSFGTTYKGKKVGSMGDIVCFSFDGIKNITCGEGGAIVSQDNSVLEYIKDARLLGIHKDTQKRYQGLRSWEFDVSHQGYRYHMSNLFAAIGLVQLDRLEAEFKPARQRIAKYYQKMLRPIKGILLFEDDYEQTIPHIFPIRVLDGKRDLLREYLMDSGIECGIHYYPNHLLTYYGNLKGKLPATEKIYNQLLSIPLHPGLREEDQEYIIENIRKFFETTGGKK